MAGLHQTVKKWLAEDVYDTRRFEEAYGFQTKTSLEDGLRREVDWYKKQVLRTERALNFVTSRSIRDKKS
jgi:dTDP-D-glucose 4,6-dehydratase